MEYKSIAFDVEVKESPLESDQWIIEGYASTYDIDSGNDRIEKGAFKNTIKERFTDPKALNGKSKIKALWQHNTDDLIGTILELREDPKGLFCRIQLFRDPVFCSAEKAYRLAKYGEIDSFSIGYKPVVWEYEEIDNACSIRIIKELKLYEISVVTFPMNERAEFTNVKKDGELMLMNEEMIKLLTEIRDLLKADAAEDVSEACSEEGTLEAKTAMTAPECKE